MDTQATSRAAADSYRPSRGLQSGQRRRDGALARDRLMSSPRPSLALPGAALDTAELEFLPRQVRDGEDPGDPINLVLKGDREQIRDAFFGAGWIEPVPRTLGTYLKQILCGIVRRPYLDAPVSNLYLDGRPHDLAFQLPSLSVHKRHHLRAWDTGRDDVAGRRIWAVAATEDVGVGLHRRKLARCRISLTHRINAEIDRERDLVALCLVGAGAVSQGGWLRGPARGSNGGGDKFRTDGRVPVLLLP